MLSNGVEFKFIYFVVLMIVVLGYVYPKSKVVFYLEIIMYMVIIGGYNGNLDLVFYRNRYEKGIISDTVVEGLYDYVAAFFANCGLNFDVYHFLLSAFAIIIISYVVKKMSPEPALVMSMLFGFSTIEYAVQMKNLCAAAIIIYALYYYYRERQIYNAEKRKLIDYRLIYAILVVIATGFHFLSLFFFVFLLIDFVNVKYLKYWIISIVLIAMVIYSYVENLLVILVAQLADYVGQYRSFSVIMGMIIWQWSGMIIVTLMYRYFKRKNASENLLYMSTYIYKGSLLMMLVTPFYLVTTTVNRIIKIWQLFYFVLTSQIKSSYRKFNLLKIVMILYGLLSTIVFYFIIMKFEESVVWEVLNNNMFFN